MLSLVEDFISNAQNLQVVDFNGNSMSSDQTGSLLETLYDSPTVLNFTEVYMSQADFTEGPTSVQLITLIEHATNMGKLDISDQVGTRKITVEYTPATGVDGSIVVKDQDSGVVIWNKLTKRTTPLEIIQ